MYSKDNKPILFKWYKMKWTTNITYILEQLVLFKYIHLLISILKLYKPLFESNKILFLLFIIYFTSLDLIKKTNIKTKYPTLHIYIKKKKIHMIHIFNKHNYNINFKLLIYSYNVIIL